MKIFDYMKANPWTTGALVIGGGLTFIVLSGWFSGGGGGGVTVAAPSGPSEDAQLAFASLQAQQQMAGQQTSAQVAVAELQAEMAKFMTDREAGVALAQIEAGKYIASNEVGASRDIFSMQTGATVDIAQIQATIDAQNIEAERAIRAQNIEAERAIRAQTIAAERATQVQQLDTTKYLEDRKITSNENIITKLLDAFKPQPSPPPEQAVPRFDPYNTAKRDQPLLQGYDISIAQAIDRGEVIVDRGGYITIPGDNDSTAGSYVAINPLDLRWLNYTPGSYSKTGAVF